MLWSRALLFNDNGVDNTNRFPMSVTNRGLPHFKLSRTPWRKVLMWNNSPTGATYIDLRSCVLVGLEPDSLKATWKSVLLSVAANKHSKSRAVAVAWEQQCNLTVKKQKAFYMKGEIHSVAVDTAPSLIWWSCCNLFEYPLTSVFSTLHLAIFSIFKMLRTPRARVGKCRWTEQLWYCQKSTGKITTDFSLITKPK